MGLDIVKYSDKYEKAWDSLVMNNSVNGTFLQTRRFLNYHPKDRFQDASLMVMQGNNIVAAIPACDAADQGERCFFSHKGSTFGGIVFKTGKYDITTLDELIPSLDSYLRSEGYDRILLKCTSQIFSKKPVDLLDYFLFLNGYEPYCELSLYVDLEQAPEDLLAALSSSRRRDYRYSLSHDLVFRRLETDEEIRQFHSMLSNNLLKFNARPVHTPEEMLLLKRDTLPDETDFYGAFYGDRMIAGTMLFYFGQQVLHTQYLANDSEYSRMFPMNYLDFQLISMAREKGFRYFSFGISTEDRGKTLNKGLALFKEGFGCSCCVNRSYIKQL